MSQTLKAAPAAPTPPAYNKNCTITNSSTVDIVVLDAYAPSDAVTTQQIYEQTLKPLTTADGQKIIKAGKSGTVVLNDTHKDSDGNDVYTKIYDLIIAKADSLYPLASVPAMMSSSRANPAYSYDPVTITDDMYKNMQLAENFQQTIMAFPTSKLATDYQKAMSGTTDTASSDTGIDDSVSSFFGTTKQYQKVTLDMVVSISTYYSQFPYVWAGYGTTTKSYYLYSSDGSKVTYGGQVDITAPADVPANTDKSLPGFKISFTDASNNQKPLYYENGQFVDSKDSDNPSVCLQGLFVLKSQLTKKDADNTVIAILSGTANNSKVMGYPDKQEQDDQGNWSGLYALLHPKDAMGWIQLFMTFMGVMMGVDFVVKGLKGLKDSIKGEKANNDGKDPSPSEVDNLRTEVKNLKTQVDATNQKMLDKMNENLKVSEDINKSMSDLKQQMQDQINEDQRSLLDDSLDTQSDLLEKALKYGNNSALDDIDDKIGDAQDKLDGAETGELGDVLPDVKITVGDVTVKLKVQVERLSSKVSQDAKESMEEATKELDDAKDTSDNIEDNADDTANGDVPEDVDFPPVEV